MQSSGNATASYVIGKCKMMHLGLEFESDHKVSKRKFERIQSCLAKMRTDWILPRIYPMVTLLLTVLDVARKTEIINTYITFVEIPEVKKHHERFCRRRADNIKMDLE